MGQRRHEVRRGFRVSGRVQGVGFRWWTQKTAEELDLAGTVGNRADGTVEIHARGSEESMDTFARRIQRGPAAARVEGVEDVPSEGSLPDTFRIVR